jgi:DNA-binding NarL/FixJ family response regulator
MMATRILRVMIVDDNRIVREGLTIFLKLFADLQFVGAAVNGAEALQQCPILQPDVILMDIVMPEMSGIEATRVLHAQYPHIKIIGLTSFSGDETHREAMLAAGAVACLPKHASIDEIARAIRNL